MPAPTANIKFTADNADLLSKMKQAEQQFGSVDNRVAGLSSSVNSLVRTVGTYLTVQTALNLAKLGESFENARVVFGKYVEDVEAGSARLRQASKNQLDDLKLLQLANEAFRKGLSFSQVELGLQWAELQADQARDTIEGAFTKVTRALSRTEAGVGRTAGVLNDLGFTATTVSGIMAEMSKAVTTLSDNLDDSSDAVAQFETRWTNASIKIGQSVRQFILPALETMSRLLSEEEAKSEGSILNNLSASLDGLFQGMSVDDPKKIDNILNMISELREKIPRGAAELQDFENLFLMINEAAADPNLNNYTEDLRKAAETVEAMIALRTKPIENKNTRNFDPFLNPEEIAAQTEAQAKANKEAEAAAAAALQAKRDKLFQEREIVKAQISLGQATYADLKTILDRQKTDNEAFLESDFQAKISWMQDSALIYQQDKANAAEAQAAIYNMYRGTTEEILQNEYLTQEEKFQMARQTIDFAIQNEKLTLDQILVLSQQKRAIESEYTQFLMAEYQKQLELYTTIFGNPALQLIDDFFTSGELRFEEFIKNILRTAARYAAQALILRLFTSLIPFGGVAGGAVGGGFLGGGGILGGQSSGPNLTGGLPDLSGLNYRGGFAPATSPAASSQNNQSSGTLVNVQILATPEQLAALVHTGNQQRDRSNLAS